MNRSEVHEQALRRFVEISTEIDDKLKQLREYAVDNHFGYSPDEIFWSHVGIACRMLDMINEIFESIACSNLRRQFEKSRRTDKDNVEE